MPVGPTMLNSNHDHCWLQYVYADCTDLLHCNVCGPQRLMLAGPFWILPCLHGIVCGPRQLMSVGPSISNGTYDHFMCRIRRCMP